MSISTIIVDFLCSNHNCTRFLKYSESDDEIRFQIPTPISNPLAAEFRSRASVLNEFAVSHQLSLLVGRGKYGVPGDFTFAIKTIESAVQSIGVVDEYHVSLRFEVMARRHGIITAVRSILITKYFDSLRRTIATFSVIPPSLANFVRRARQFLDFADVKMERDSSYLSTVADDHSRYYPSESDRLSDGKRVDHVPALTLIDIALWVDGMAHEGTFSSSISAEFLNYVDPRREFDILRKKAHGAVEFVQNGQLVAIVSNGESPGVRRR